MGYCTLAMTTYSGMGGDFMQRYVKPHFKKEAAREKLEGGTGWETRTAKRAFLDRAASIMAKANAGMLRWRDLFWPR